MNRNLLKCYLFLLLASFILLSACGGKEMSTEKNTQDKTEQASVQKTNKEENQQTSGKTKNTGKSLSNVKEVLNKAEEAMGQISGMAFTGVIELTSDDANETDESTTQITGELTLDPLAMNIIIQSEGVPVDIEMYLVEGILYTNQFAERWISMDVDGAGDLSSMGMIWGATHFHYITEHAEQLELSERDGNYIVTYSGSGDALKSLIYGHTQEVIGSEYYDDLINAIEEASGTYELTIDKKTFYVIAMTTDIEETMNEEILGKIHSKTKTHTEYSNFNNVKVTVPDEVKENAQTLQSMYEDE